MTRRERRPIRRLIAFKAARVLVIASTLAVAISVNYDFNAKFTPPAVAQSPTPDHHFYAVAPGARSLSHAGVTVQGLGMDGCDSRRVPAEQDAVYYVDNSMPVWLEISPQAGCTSISGYESEISSILSYVNSNTGDTQEGNYFDGIMVDEEDGFGFSVSQLTTLNQYLENQVATTPGHTFWSLEGFVANGGNADGCDWTFSQYKSVLIDGYQAEQAEHQCNINLLNSSTHEAAVTWYSGYTPGNTQANACNPVTTPQSYWDAGKGYYWSNEFAST